jgi:ribosomal protein S2
MPCRGVKVQINIDTEDLIDASKEVDLEVNTEKTKYMFLSCHQNAGQNHDIKVANTAFENVLQFRYLGMSVTNQNSIQKEIKRKLNLGNVCYHCSVQKLLSSHLLSKKHKK